MRPRALDLFCGAGGASVGLHQAGFDVTGVDINPMPRYPFKFIQADALTFPLDGYDLIWASPPCQAYVSLSRGEHPKLIEPIREKLKASQCPYIIENVVGAPLKNPIKLCGSMFGLNVRRHRLFETPIMILTPQCRHDLQKEIRAYYGDSPGGIAKPNHVNTPDKKPLLRGSVEQALEDMGIDWMTWPELREAVPPAYAEFLGRWMMWYVNRKEARRRLEVIRERKS